ncbi:hypothetical protein D1007_26702 [Hordeum vulgare]|nr:hypothetical protein D1007_26702 [Hordeum vulgare]
MYPTLVGDVQRQLTMVSKLILQLNATQDFRLLSTQERELRAKLKSISLGAVSSADAMNQLAHEHFSEIFGAPQPTTTALNWDVLDLDHVDLCDIEDDFTLYEIKKAINDMPTEKAPGPDGFFGGFFRACWDVIKMDVLAALQQLHHVDSKGMRRVNRALIVLIP